MAEETDFDHLYGSVIDCCLCNFSTFSLNDFELHIKWHFQERKPKLVPISLPPSPVRKLNQPKPRPKAAKKEPKEAEGVRTIDEGDEFSCSLCDFNTWSEDVFSAHIENHFSEPKGQIEVAKDTGFEVDSKPQTEETLQLLHPEKEIVSENEPVGTANKDPVPEERIHAPTSRTSFDAKLFSKTAVVVVKNMTQEEIEITCKNLRQDIPLLQPSEHDAEIAQMKILLNQIVYKGHEPNRTKEVLQFLEKRSGSKCSFANFDFRNIKDGSELVKSQQSKFLSEFLIETKSYIALCKTCLKVFKLDTRRPGISATTHMKSHAFKGCHNFEEKERTKVMSAAEEDTCKKLKRSIGALHSNKPRDLLNLEQQALLTNMKQEDVENICPKPSGQSKARYSKIADGSSSKQRPHLKDVNQEEIENIDLEVSANDSNRCSNKPVNFLTEPQTLADIKDTEKPKTAVDMINDMIREEFTDEEDKDEDMISENLLNRIGLTEVEIRIDPLNLNISNFAHTVDEPYLCPNCEQTLNSDSSECPKCDQISPQSDVKRQKLEEHKQNASEIAEIRLLLNDIVYKGFQPRNTEKIVKFIEKTFPHKGMSLAKMSFGNLTDGSKLTKSSQSEFTSEFLIDVYSGIALCKTCIQPFKLDTRRGISATTHMKNHAAKLCHKME